MSGQVRQRQTIKWVSVDPRTKATVPYDDAVCSGIEDSFQKKKATHVLPFGKGKFTIHFEEMLQKNDTGGARKVMRLVEGPRTPPPELTPDLFAIVLDMVARVDVAVKQYEQNEANFSFVVPQKNFEAFQGAVLVVYEHILAGLLSDRVKARYGFNLAEDQVCCGIQFGDPVPSYFANVKDGQSIWHRKALSLLGLRNLVRFGHEIFLEMRSKAFSGCLDDYKKGEGVHKMKHFTGNVVDLDSTVLRLHEKDVVATINMSQKANGLPTFKDGKEIAESEAGKRIALSCARGLVEGFVERFKLNPAQQASRRLLFNWDDTSAIPVATGHTDRGKNAVWFYNNVGLLTFHANVPNMSDVYGALFKAPFHLAKAWILIRQQSKSVQELTEALDDFYENAISDSCFNAKWKSIEMFLEGRESFGNIEDELNKLQMKNQAIFTAEFYQQDDDEGTKEFAAMCKLVQEAQLSGVDPATKTVRPITQADILVWHKKRLGL